MMHERTGKGSFDLTTTSNPTRLRFRELRMEFVHVDRANAGRCPPTRQAAQKLSSVDVKVSTTCNFFCLACCHILLAVTNLIGEVLSASMNCRSGGMVTSFEDEAVIPRVLASDDDVTVAEKQPAEKSYPYTVHICVCLK